MMSGSSNPIANISNMANMMMMSGSSSGTNWPNMECLLQGSVPNESLDQLIERLEGICGKESTLRPQVLEHTSHNDSTTATASLKLKRSNTIHIHEMCYTQKTPSVTGHSSSGSEMVLRVRHYYDLDKWQLCWVGQGEFSDQKRSTVVRASLLVDVTDSSVCHLLEAMGFTFDYELLKTGDVFTHSNASGTTKVDTYVYRIQKLQQRGDISSAVPLTNSGCLVEISSYCSSDKIPESEEEIHSLAEKLVPLVVVAKLDHRVFQPQTAATSIPVTASPHIHTYQHPSNRASPMRT